MEVLIFIGVLAITIMLGRYAISEGQRLERHKKFMNDMKNFDSKKKNK